MKPKILCVDDEVEITNSLARLLSRHFKMFTAHNVNDARSIIESELDLAIVLSDLRMPDGTGFDVLKHAETLQPAAIRALLTAHVDPDDVADGLHRRLVHRVILKPWENDYLRVQMLEALSAHQLLVEKRELENLAITDPVTLLRNHRFFQDQLKIEIARSQRHSRPLSLIMIDLDNFKAFNDAHGHPAGDRLLRDVARRLGEAVRNLDTVARYGGEEFAIILPDTPLERATLVAERVRNLFSANPFLVDDSSTLVTISLGVATCPTHATTVESLIEVADRALYRAKGQGRNQSVVANTHQS